MYSSSPCSIPGNTARNNVANFIYETITLLPEEHTLDVLSGIATAYPNAFYLISRKNLPAFTDRIRNLASEQDYDRLVLSFGVRRTSPRFWTLSDEINAEYGRTMPIEAGLLDYSRLESR